jgi:hypothetical protein
LSRSANAPSHFQIPTQWQDASSHRKQTLVVPAVISLLLFLVLTFIVVPLWRYYRLRYGQYLPLDSITSHTTSLRQRVTDSLVQFMVNPPWRRNRGPVPAEDNDLEEGEELDVVDDDMWDAVDSRIQTGPPDTTSRLSREYAVCSYTTILDLY